MHEGSIAPSLSGDLRSSPHRPQHMGIGGRRPRAGRHSNSPTPQSIPAPHAPSPARHSRRSPLSAPAPRAPVLGCSAREVLAGAATAAGGSVVARWPRGAALGGRHCRSGRGQGAREAAGSEGRAGNGDEGARERETTELGPGGAHGSRRRMASRGAGSRGAAGEGGEAGKGEGNGEGRAEVRATQRSPW